MSASIEECVADRMRPVHAFSRLHLRPQHTTSAIVCYTIVCALLLVSPLRSLLVLVFPALSLLLAFYLFSRSKARYAGFALWIWFVAPFVRRMVDEQAGPEQAILLAPYLVAAVAAIYVVRNLHVLASADALHFVCALWAILYGLCIGIMHFSPLVIGQTLCEWLVPVVFAIFLYAQPDDPEGMRRTFRNAFCWALILSAAYGILQFFSPPSWDLSWLAANQDDLVEIGPAAAMQFRVFSTMNSPTVYAVAVMAGLLLLPTFPKSLRIPAAVLGFFAILLTGSRTAWLGFAAGLIVLFAHADKQRRWQLMVQLGILAVLLGVLLRVPVVGTFLSDRLDPFTDIKSDDSYGDRVEGYEEGLRRVTHEPFGEGLGSAPALHTDEVIGPHDSSFLESLYSLGWLGTLLYAGGLLLAGIATFRSSPAAAGNGDSAFVDAGRAIFIAFVIQSPLNSIMLGQAGFILWAVVALTLKELQPHRQPSANSLWQPAADLLNLSKPAQSEYLK